MRVRQEGGGPRASTHLHVNEHIIVDLLLRLFHHKNNS